MLREVAHLLEMAEPEASRGTPPLFRTSSSHPLHTHLFTPLSSPPSPLLAQIRMVHDYEPKSFGLDLPEPLVKEAPPI